MSGKPSPEAMKFQHGLQQMLHDSFEVAIAGARPENRGDVLNAFVGALVTEAILILAIAVNRKHDQSFTELVTQDVGAVLKRHFPCEAGTGQHVMRSSL